MTVQDVSPAVSYTLTGITDYPFLFEVFEDENIEVIYIDDIGSSPVEWELNTDFTVTVNVDRTGTVHVVDTAAEGTIYISRTIPVTQEVAWVNNDPLDMVVQENSFDKLTMIIQDLDAAQISYPPGFPLDVEFPFPEAGQIIGWNDTADSLQNYPGYGNFQSLYDAAAAAAAAAAASETAAATSETNAATSETNAASSASDSAASAAAAAVSEANAAASEAAIAGAEANCAASETAALAAQVAAEAAQSNAEDAEANAEISAQEAANCAAAASASSYLNWEEVSNNFRPITDDGGGLGDDTNQVSFVKIANDPAADNEAVRLSYLSAMLYEEPIVNLITNGDFPVAQRATSQTTNGAGSIDRWYPFSNGSTLTFSQETFLPGQTDVPGGPTNYCKTIAVTGGTASDLVITRTYVFNVYTFSNVPVILAFSAKADSSKNIATECVQNFGSGGSSAVDSIGVTTHSLSTSWQSFYALMTPPSISGLTVGTLSYLQINFWLDAGSDYDSRTNSLGNQSGTFEIADVQLLYGSNAKAFQRKSFEDTLLDCLPYYEQSYYSGVVPGTATFTNSAGFHARAGSSQYNNVRFLREKVVNPAITLYSPSTGSSGYVYNVDATSDISASASTVGASGFLALGLGATPSAGDRLAYHWTADTGY